MGRALADPALRSAQVDRRRDPAAGGRAVDLALALSAAAAARRYSADAAARRARDALDALCAADRTASDRLDRHLGLSGAAAGVRAVRAAEDLARRSAVLRAAVRSAPMAGHRARGRGSDAYRCRPSPPFRAQGPGSHAHAHRLTAAVTPWPARRQLDRSAN